ncbi:MAG: hypothetical protein QOE55_6068 [Acidobacteriaceae bacterium]|nr:hypothetical protein [Acidobacteriaceae bacterium]
MVRLKRQCALGEELFWKIQNRRNYPTLSKACGVSGGYFGLPRISPNLRNGERCRERYRLHPQTRSWPGRLSRARAPPIGDASSEIDPL